MSEKAARNFRRVADVLMAAGILSGILGGLGTFAYREVVGGDPWWPFVAGVWAACFGVAAWRSGAS